MLLISARRLQSPTGWIINNHAQTHPPGFLRLPQLLTIGEADLEPSSGVKRFAMILTVRRDASVKTARFSTPVPCAKAHHIVQSNARQWPLRLRLDRRAGPRTLLGSPRSDW